MSIQDQLTYKRHSDDTDKIQKSLAQKLRLLEIPGIATMVKKSFNDLLLIEQQMLRADHLIGVAVSEYGEILEKLVSNVYSITFSDSTTSKLSRGIISHNHQMSVPCTEEDVMFLLANRVRELRTITKKGIYIFQNREEYIDLPPDKLDKLIKDVQRSFRTYWVDYYYKVEDIYPNLSDTDKLSLLLSEVWKSLKNDYRFIYFFQEYDYET